jgi:hypothetical protein
LERGLPAKNDDVVYLKHRTTQFAGKPRSNNHAPPVTPPHHADWLADETLVRFDVITKNGNADFLLFFNRS